MYDHLARETNTNGPSSPGTHPTHVDPPKTTSAIHYFDVPSFNYDIFSFLFFSSIFLLLFSFYVYHLACTQTHTHTACTYIGPDNIICYSARLGCTTAAVLSLEDFFPGRRKNPKINWFCLRYSSLSSLSIYIYIYLYVKE